MGWFCQRCGHEAAAAGVCPQDGEVLSRVSTHDLLGRKIGEYTVLANLGGGSFGKVYRAVHERSGLLVAIKLLHQAIDAAESKRVMIEARAAAMIQHPNVAQVYDLGMTSDRRPYIVMQLLEGQPLSKLLVTQVPVPVVVSIANDVLAALGVAHQRGVIHRDLKPDNIFIVSNHVSGGRGKSRAVIVDFGLAKLIGDPRAPSLTASGEALGTPHYMAPEQVRGELCDGRADLYALGCVMFEALAGRPPFSGSATYAIFDAHLHTQPPRISELRPDVPPAVERAIDTALAKNVGSRFASAADMQRALAGVVVSRRRWPVVVAVVAILAVIGGGVTAAVLAQGGTETVTVEPDKPGPKPPEKPTRPPPHPEQLPDEPPLDPDHQRALDEISNSIKAGMYRRSDLLQMRCAVQDIHVKPPAGFPLELRAYFRRMVALIESHVPDLDAVKECPKLPPPVPQGPYVPSTKPHRFPFPKALPEELPVLDGFEQAIEGIHDQLEAGHFTRDSAHGMHCMQVLALAKAKEQREAELPRQSRGLYRRFDILLEAYLPGIDQGTVSVSRLPLD